MTPTVLHKLQDAQRAASVSAASERYAGGEREAEVNAHLAAARQARRQEMGVARLDRRGGG